MNLINDSISCIIHFRQLILVVPQWGSIMRSLALVMVLIFITGCAMKTPFSATITADGKYWVVTKPLIYVQPNTKQRFEVPKGFVTDLASVPRLFWIALPPCGKYTPAAVVHDYIYWYQPPDCDRKCADDLLLIALEESKVGLATRTAIYEGVRIGGKSSWKENAELRDSGTIRFIPEEYMNFGPYDTWTDIEARIRRKQQSKISEESNVTLNPPLQRDILSASCLSAPEKVR